MFLPRENNIHVFEPSCNVLFILYGQKLKQTNRKQEDKQKNKPTASATALKRVNTVFNPLAGGQEVSH